jgi:hypothetical protein
VQTAPTFVSGGAAHDIASSDITADIALDQRKKGLLWYSTYAVDFDAVYGVASDGDEAERVDMTFAFPAADGVYDGFAVTVDGSEVPVRYGDGTAHASFDLDPGETSAVGVAYRTQGQDEWRYAPSGGSVGVIEDYRLAMTTDFEKIDFPDDAVSPTSKTQTAEGWELLWEYDRLVSGRAVGVSMPTPLNPGPVASRISFFAPIALLFYFAAVVLVSTTRGVRIHPINYAFLAAGMFAFHLLFAYLVDRVDIAVAFAIASVVSVGMCTAYLKLFIADTQALVELAVSQIVFLVLFSFTFFFEGLTGLAVAIGSVLTLGYFMVRTGRVDWERVFARQPRPEDGGSAPTPPEPIHEPTG